MSEFAFTWWLRSLQALIDAGPTLLAGVLLAGGLRYMTGAAVVRGWFGPPTVGGLWRALGWAFVAPVCSLGVLPVAWALLRLGVARRQVMVFLLAAPLVNPVTLVYWLGTMDPTNLAFLVGLGACLALGAGRIAGRDADEAAGAAVDLPATAGLRLASAGLEVTRLAGGPFLLVVLATVALSGLSAACWPVSSYFSERLPYDNPWAGPLAFVGAFPAYLSPWQALVQLTHMSQFQYSHAAMAVLLVFGLGLGPAGVVALAAWSGRRGTAVILLLWIVGLTFAAGYLANAVLPHPAGSEEDTHSLDVLSSPAALGEVTRNWTVGWHWAFRKTVWAQQAVLAALGGLAAAGIVLRILRISPPVAQSAAAVTVLGRGTRFNAPLSPGSLRASAVLLLLAAGVFGLYVFYPPPRDTMAELAALQANAYMAALEGDTSLARAQLERWDVLASRIPPASVLRFGPPDPSAPQRLAEVRRRMADAAAAIRTGHTADACRQLIEIREAWVACRAAYLGPTEAPVPAETDLGADAR